MPAPNIILITKTEENKMFVICVFHMSLQMSSRVPEIRSKSAFKHLSEIILSSVTHLSKVAVLPVNASKNPAVPV